MTRDELTIEISILYTKVDTLVKLQQNLVDSENYEDAAKVRDYLILTRQILLIYTLMIENERSNYL